MSTRMSTRRFVLAPLALSACIALVACSQPAETGVSSSETNTSEASASEARSVAAEVTNPQARLVATYDGGITVLDAETLEEITDIPLDGFNRLNPLGDQRTVAVSTPEGFRVLDAGAWTQPHGDHSHSYTTDPLLTEQVFAGDKPGHVVNNAGRTLLFSDGDGIIQELDNEALTAGSQDAELELPDAADETFELTPHHGVAVALGDGGMVHTEGTEDERSTIVAVDADGEETARIDTCPGVHGEAVAGNGAITFGCEDGVVIYQDGEFTKATAPDDYGRMGNQAGSEHSPVVLADYKVDKDAELERPTRVALINTEKSTDDAISLVDVDASYSFRSLGRGPNGEALVLGTDGNLRIIDPETAEITKSIPVTDAWEEPTQWQQPRPTLFVQGEKAFITEPGAHSIHVVDLSSGEVEQSVNVGKEFNEITGVEG